LWITSFVVSTTFCPISFVLSIIFDHTCLIPPTRSLAGACGALSVAG
jgi:hypothetical protein